MAEPLSTQVNIRMSPSLKERGDAAFASLGYSASEIVRKIWELASSGPVGLERMQRLLAPESQALQGKESEARLHMRALAEQGSLLYAKFRSTQGLTSQGPASPQSYDELLETETWERLDEKGLL